jgi:hypothetical protein
MNPRNSRILLLLALVLLTYIMVFERGSRNRGLAPVSVPLLDGFRPEYVTSVELQWGSNVHCRVERTNGLWQMVLPVRYPAAGQRLDRFLEMLAEARERHLIPAAEVLAQPRGRAAFGLEPPEASLTLTVAGVRRELRLGAIAFGGRQLYVQRIGSEGVSVIEGGFWSLLPGSPADWRSRALVEVPPSPWTRIEAKAEGGQYELRRHPVTQLWQLTRPRVMRAHHLRIDNLIQLLQTVEVAGFVSDGVALGLEAYGLEPARQEIALAAGTNELVRIRFGTSPTNQPGVLYAYLAPSRSVVLVPRHVSEVLSLAPRDLMDPHLIAVSPSAVSRIDVVARETFALVRQGTNTWRMASPRDFPVDPLLVDELVGRLNQLEILDVEKDVVTELDFPGYGFAPTNWQYTLLSTITNTLGLVTNDVLAQVQLGTNAQDRILVRRSDESPVYVTRASDAALLPQVALQFRDRRVFRFTTNQVTAITIRSQDRVLKWVRGADGVWMPLAGTAATTVALGEVLFPEMLFRWGQLQAQFWGAQDETQLARLGIPQAAHQLTIEYVQQGQPVAAVLDLGGQSPLLAPWGAVRLPDQPERVGFAFPFYFYEPYRQILRELDLPLPETPP